VTSFLRLIGNRKGVSKIASIALIAVLLVSVVSVGIVFFPDKLFVKDAGEENTAYEEPVQETEIITGGENNRFCTG